MSMGEKNIPPPTIKIRKRFYEAKIKMLSLVDFEVINIPIVILFLNE